MNTLKTYRLSKSYQKNMALDNVSITLKSGKIYGLIGQNGAGKTTLMRLTAGLSFPTKGTIELFGQQGVKNLQKARKRIGCMIEYPSLIPQMTALENMRQRRIMRGIPNKEIETELLSLVGLSNTGKKKVQHFSLGMKQRLGIAVALIGNPELLILDEPINGLDPVGVVEVRNLLKKLCEELQMTILISSHNLPELYQTATDYIIIHQGKVKKTLTLAELDEQCRHHLSISCEQPEKLAGIIESQLHTTNYQVMPDKSIKLYDFLEQKDAVAKLLYDNQIIVSNLSEEGDTLENYFIQIIGGDRND